ncbi:Protein of unknown function DUF54 [Ignisphaera aggregans DSM 17230]|uniref:Exosome protein n=1 Tax=Ignisphaera aggregans (strain DSM 17230 / JCM 13409 / AQ1.S1) TaxID=583356 RepID=E0SPM2_IGNAA|nr:Protein of unknown function DUF54 [Ignisphaera aggregans DSM 17230]
MRRDIEVTEITITTHCHATEDIEKVKKAFLNVIPRELHGSTKIDIEVLHGYYGNPITKLKSRFKNNEAIQVLKHILSLLSKSDISYILSSLELRYYKKSNKIYLRLDKQAAYLGRLALYEGDDAIVVEISFSVLKSLEAVKEYINRLYMELQNVDRSISSS